VGEIFVQRDGSNRIVGVAIHDISADTAVGTAVLGYLQTVAESLTTYLHVPVVGGTADDFGLAVDRADLHLDRELDAILETLVIGLRLLETRFPGEMTVHEATVGVEV